MALHKDLTGTDLHEPKGAAAASSNTTYFSDGAGSGSWRKIVANDIDMTSLQNPNTIYLTGVIDDVSAPSAILIPIPDQAVFQSAQFTLGAAITVADSTVTLTRNDGSSFGSPVTITQSGSAEGTTFTFTATLNQTISSGGYIKIATDGGSTTTAPLYVTVKLLRSI